MKPCATCPRPAVPDCRLCGRCKKVKEVLARMSSWVPDGTTFTTRNPLPDQPTDAPPGSEQKMAVMTERASREQQLHHPQDARGWSDGCLPLVGWQPEPGQALRPLSSSDCTEVE